MATRQIGKLKYHISRQGIACRWGEGAIHRLRFDRFRKQNGREYDSQPYGDDG